MDASRSARHFGRGPSRIPAPLPRGVTGLSALTQPEDEGRDEIQAGADQRRQSECESDANRKANIDKPVFVPGRWRIVGMCGVGNCFAFVDLAAFGLVAV